MRLTTGTLRVKNNVVQFVMTNGQEIDISPVWHEKGGADIFQIQVEKFIDYARLQVLDGEIWGTVVEDAILAVSQSSRMVEDDETRITDTARLIAYFGTTEAGDTVPPEAVDPCLGALIRRGYDRDVMLNG